MIQKCNDAFHFHCELALCRWTATKGCARERVCAGTRLPQQSVRTTQCLAYLRYLYIVGQSEQQDIFTCSCYSKSNNKVCWSYIFGIYGKLLIKSHLKQFVKLILITGPLM